MGKNQHVVRRDDKWVVKGAGNQRATRVTDTQKQAIEIARGIAVNQRSELIVHGQDGRIRSKDSFGNDTNPPRDTESTRQGNRAKVVPGAGSSGDDMIDLSVTRLQRRRAASGRGV